jgi:RecA/RadA recombinase
MVNAMHAVGQTIDALGKKNAALIDRQTARRPDRRKTMGGNASE